MTEATDDDETAEWLAVQDRLRDAVAKAVDGSDWSPPSGAIITDCVVVMGWNRLDGTYASSHVRCGSAWATHGLLIQSLERIEQQNTAENAPDHNQETP